MNWELILEFAVAVAAIAVTLFLVPWLREKLGQERAERLEELIWKAVQAAEQLFGPERGAEKKAYVVQYLAAQGIDAAAHDADIEAAVLQINQIVRDEAQA